MTKLEILIVAMCWALPVLLMSVKLIIAARRERRWKQLEQEGR